MKTLKILSFLLLGLMLFIGCKNNNNGCYYYGYIYNLKDSTPYANTEFKLYTRGGNWQGKQVTEEETFYTNQDGKFNVFTHNSGMFIVWPSYSDNNGNIYDNGPYPHKHNSYQNPFSREWYYSYDTLYLAPPSK